MILLPPPPPPPFIKVSLSHIQMHVKIVKFIEQRNIIHLYTYVSLLSVSRVTSASTGYWLTEQCAETRSRPYCLSKPRYEILQAKRASASVLTNTYLANVGNVVVTKKVTVHNGYK